MNTELTKVYEKIRNYCRNRSTYESGGHVYKNYDIDFFEPVEKHESCYLPNIEFYMNLINKKEDILFSFHSHLEETQPSEEDISFIRVYNINSLIYILKS